MKAEFIGYANSGLDIVCLMGMDLYPHAFKYPHEGVKMEVKREIRLLAVKLIVFIVFFRLKKLLPHKGGAHHPCSGSLSAVSEGHLRVFAQGHFHGQLRADEAGFHVLAGGLDG